MLILRQSAANKWMCEKHWVKKTILSHQREFGENIYHIWDIIGTFVLQLGTDDWTRVWVRPNFQPMWPICSTTDCVKVQILILWFLCNRVCVCVCVCNLAVLSCLCECYKLLSCVFGVILFSQTLWLDRVHLESANLFIRWPAMHVTSCDDEGRPWTETFSLWNSVRLCGPQRKKNRLQSDLSSDFLFSVCVSFLVAFWLFLDAPQRKSNKGRLLWTAGLWTKCRRKENEFNTEVCISSGHGILWAAEGVSGCLGGVCWGSGQRNLQVSSTLKHRFSSSCCFDPDWFDPLVVTFGLCQIFSNVFFFCYFSDDHVKFFCFQVLEHQIKFRWGGRGSDWMSSLSDRHLIISTCVMSCVLQTRWSECSSAAAHQRDSDEVAPVSGTARHADVKYFYSKAVLRCSSQVPVFNLSICDTLFCDSSTFQGELLYYFITHIHANIWSTSRSHTACTCFLLLAPVYMLLMCKCTRRPFYIAIPFSNIFTSATSRLWYKCRGTGGRNDPASVLP